MMRCDQAGRLFGAYWDDEVTQAEREWLDAHLAGCAGCRTRYEHFARTLELAGSLARVETASDLPERALAAARRAVPTPDRITVPAARPAWVPVAAVAGLLIVGASVIVPLIASKRSDESTVALGSSKVPEARLVASAQPGPETPSAPRTRITDAVVPSLLGMRALEKVLVSSTALTAAALGQLRARAGLTVVG